MDKIIGIELDRYGFSIDSEWLYVSISWQLILTSALVFGILRFVKLRKIGKVIK